MTNNLNRRAALALCGLAVFGILAERPSHGMSADHATRLTFSKPIALPGVTLGAGTYVFERAAPGSSLEIVRVSSADRRRVVFTGYTELVRRPAGSKADVTFGEAPRGAAVPVAAWYPSDTPIGHRFLYR